MRTTSPTFVVWVGFLFILVAFVEGVLVERHAARDTWEQIRLQGRNICMNGTKPPVTCDVIVPDVPSALAVMQPGDTLWLRPGGNQTINWRDWLTPQEHP